MTETVLSHADGDPGAYETLVLGIGNILWADEGFGIRTVEALHSKYEMPEGVRIMDGGTQGIFLLPLVRNAKRLLIFDAVDFGDAPAPYPTSLPEGARHTITSDGPWLGSRPDGEAIAAPSLAADGDDMAGRGPLARPIEATGMVASIPEIEKTVRGARIEADDGPP